MKFEFLEKSKRDVKQTGRKKRARGRRTKNLIQRFDIDDDKERRHCGKIESAVRQEKSKNKNDLVPLTARKALQNVQLRWDGLPGLT